MQRPTEFNLSYKWRLSRNGNYYCVNSGIGCTVFERLGRYTYICGTVASSRHYREEKEAMDAAEAEMAAEQEYPEL